MLKKSVITFLYGVGEIFEAVQFEIFALHLRFYINFYK